MQIKDKTVINGIGNSKTKTVGRINPRAGSLQGLMNY